MPDRPLRHPHYTRWPIVEGYADHQSWEAGEAIPFRCASRSDRFAVTVSRIGRDRRTVLQTYRGWNQGFGLAAAAMDTNGDSKMDAIVTDSTAQAVWVLDAAVKASPPAQQAYGAICPDSAGRIARASHTPDPRIAAAGAQRLDSAPPNRLLQILPRSPPPKSLPPRKRLFHFR